MADPKDRFIKKSLKINGQAPNQQESGLFGYILLSFTKSFFIFRIERRFTG